MHSPMPGMNTSGMVLCSVSYLTAPGIGMFFMVSGALLLKRKTERAFETRVFLRRRFSKILIPLIFWSLVGWTLDYCGIKNQELNILWFMYCLAGMYLLTPVLSRWSRLINLVLHYWLILLFFVTIGAFLVPMKYPGTMWHVLENLTAFNTSYNSEHWFLFPYVLLAISAPWLFRLCNKNKTSIILGISYAMYLMTCFLISRYGETYLYTHMFVYHPILYGSLLFNFLLGALAYKKDWLKILNNCAFSQWAWLILILLCVVRCCLETGAFHNLYVFAFMWIWLQIVRPMWLKAFLIHMGKHSMNMWLIHSFFCYYIFHDWIYGFQYPLLIYVVLLLVSYLSSCVINLIYGLGEKGVSVIVSKIRLGY